MRVCRIKLMQSSANYRRPETVDNKMTYPLPPFSTIKGAIHAACGYREYHPMDISIQGDYQSMHTKPYTDYAFLNSTQDDRGYLVKMSNKVLLSKSYEKIAHAKSQKASFYKGDDIDIYNQSLLDEYRYLKDLKKDLEDFNKNRIKPIKDKIKKQKQVLKKRYSLIDKTDKEYKRLKSRESKLTRMGKKIDKRFNDYKKEKCERPYSKFATLTTSLKYYEILDNVSLIIHIKSDEQTMQDIIDNMYNIQCIGRSEDFVDIQEAKIVEISDEISDEIISNNSAYISADLVKNESVLLVNESMKEANGTVYYLNKDYKIENKQRIFNKKKVIYTSQYRIDEESNDVYVDFDLDNTYIVNLI